MIKLYQLEECPYCTKVRRVLAAQGLSFQAINVPKMGSQRSEVLALSGVTSPEVPVLVSGEDVVQDSSAIIEYLRSRFPEKRFGEPPYGLTRTFDNWTFSDAVLAVKEALAAEGFGVLTEIDVKATMKKKLQLDFQNYIILGACNPPLAHQALSTDPAIGLLLPCNVVVAEDDQGRVVVSAIDPQRMFSLLRQPDLEPIAKEVGVRIRRVLKALRR